MNHPQGVDEVDRTDRRGHHVQPALGGGAALAGADSIMPWESTRRAGAWRRQTSSYGRPKPWHVSAGPTALTGRPRQEATEGSR